MLKVLSKEHVIEVLDTIVSHMTFESLFPLLRHCCAVVHFQERTNEIEMIVMEKAKQDLSSWIQDPAAFYEISLSKRRTVCKEIGTAQKKTTIP